MSRGIGGNCKKIYEDEKKVSYQYSSYNLNEDNGKNNSNILDGIITIQKSVLVESEIREKINNYASEKNVIKKRISVDFSDLFCKNMITIENCNNCFQQSIEGYDVIGLNLCFKIFYEYQKRGFLPEILHYNI